MSSRHVSTAIDVPWLMSPGQWSPIGRGTHYPLPSEPHHGVSVWVFFNSFGCLPAQTVRSALGYENIEGTVWKAVLKLG